MKKKWLKRAIAMVLSFLMVLSLVACGGKDTPNTPDPAPSSNTDNPSAPDSNSSSSEPVTITALSTWAVSDIRPEKDKTLVGQWLEEQLNMDLELVTIPGEAVTTKVNAMAATGELPTILFKVGDNTAISETNKQGNKGLFLNVMDYLDKVPNYAKYLEDDFIRREMSDVDGNVYGFAKIYTDGSIMYTTPIIREDLLEGSGYSASDIKTIDDLTEVLVYLTEKMGNPAWIQRNGYSSFMEKSGLLWNLSYKTFYDYEQDAFTHPVYEDRFKQYIEWLKDLRSKKVIHPDWAVMTDETWEGLLASDQGYFTLDRMSIVGDSNFSSDFDWQPVDYPQINGKAYLQPNQVSVLPTTSWVINAHAEPEEIDKALEFMNFLYDEENHKVLTLGIEGETYTTEDPNTMAGIRWLVQIYGENADNPNAPFIYEHGIQSFTRLQTPIDMMSFPGTYPEVMYKQIDHIEKDLGGFRPASPTLAFSDEVSTLLSTKETYLNTYFDENVIKFIEGTRSMDTWDDFVQEIKDLGLDEILGYYNDAYDAYKLK